MARGTLRVYLGAAPGVGKTFAMLNEARRRCERGNDVVVGYVETHGRPKTAEQLAGLEVVPRQRIEYRGRNFEEMDVDAIVARRPDQVLVDELAHTNIPGSKHEKRWQDVDEILDAGIDVISTVNIQHLESVNDVVEQITGMAQRETVPDEVVRRADQIELVDMSPEALRRRMAHGNIYRPEKVDAALANYFRPGNLAALRELALLWVADRVDDALQQYMGAHGITAAWEARERIVVALTGAPGGDHLVRRAARIATRTKGDLLGVHVRAAEGLTGPPRGELDEHREVLESLGGRYYEVVGTDIAATLVHFARSEHATQVFLGASRRSRWSELTSGSVVHRVVRASGDIDVHVISHRNEKDRQALRRPLWRGALGISPRRQLYALFLAVIGLPVLTVVLAAERDRITHGTTLLAYLLLVVVLAAVGGVWVAGASAIAAFLLVNYFFTPPIHQWTIAERENLVALMVFLLVAGVVSALVTLAARRSLEAARARVEAATLVEMASALMVAQDPLPQIIEQVLATFELDGVAILRPAGAGGWSVVVSGGERIPGEPMGATGTTELPGGDVFAYLGPNIAAEDRRLLNAFVSQIAAALAARELRAEASHAAVVAQADALRTALLRAVSHDLRTPLASIKAAATTLLAPDLTLSAETVDQLHETIDEETDRLTELVNNLLAMSRLQAGVLQLATSDVALDEIVGRALVSLGERAGKVTVNVPDDLPNLRVDPALLERAIANVVANARAASPESEPIVIEGADVAGLMILRVIDRGPGIPVADRARVFSPFQRLGDVEAATGVGLGLAVARGFTEAMGGELQAEDTPGGGTTMTFSFPLEQR